MCLNESYELPHCLSLFITVLKENYMKDWCHERCWCLSVNQPLRYEQPSWQLRLQPKRHGPNGEFGGEKTWLPTSICGLWDVKLQKIAFSGNQNVTIVWGCNWIQRNIHQPNIITKRYEFVQKLGIPKFGNSRGRTMFGAIFSIFTYQWSLLMEIPSRKSWLQYYAHPQSM